MNVKRLGGVAAAVALLLSRVYAAVPSNESCERRAPESRWIPGVHYSVLAPSLPSATSSPRVEVVEYFMYTSPASKQFQAYLRAWMHKKASYIVYRREPAIVFSHARTQARLYLTLVTLGREDLHEKLFDWISGPEHVDAYHDTYNPNTESADHLSELFATQNGVKASRFREAYRSDVISRTLIDMESQQHNVHIWGTSTVCIDDKYCTSVQRLTTPIADPPSSSDFSRFFELIDYLTSLEASTKGVPPKIG